MFAANIAMQDYALKQGERTLEQSASRVLARAENVIRSAVDVFSALPHYRVPICDQILQDRFRGMMLRHSVIHDVGLVYNGEFMYCSSLKESMRFYAISEPVTGSVDHLSFVAVRDGLSGENGLLVQWHIRDSVSIGAFVLVDEFNLESMQTDYTDLYRISVQLKDSGVVAESTPESRLRDAAPFYQFEPDQAWTTNLIRNQKISQHYPVQVSVAIPFDAVWQSFSGAMNVINGLGFFAGGLIMFFFVRISQRKPDPYVSIEEGIRRKEFIPYYQPILDIQTGRLAGCEVLVRWQKRDGTIVPPGHFIGIAEDTGLARPMTDLLMQKVAEDLSEPYDKNPHLKVAINLFNRHFDSLAIVDEIQQIFGNSGVRFNQLVFEVTERLPLENLDRARAVINRMQALGVRVALDDAGTGHGGFAYLQKLGMDIIKIDKLFVDNIDANTTSVPIVDSLRQMAKGMNMVVVAEGVESEDQLAYLRRSGIDEAQGYLFAPPLPAKAYLELVAALGGGDRNKAGKKTLDPIPTINSDDELKASVA